jgi:tRNA pseudouridine38-40 synthase
MRVALKFAYDGFSYSGYAQQPTVVTVEQDILNLLIDNSFIISKKDSCFQTASRTDKSVSALGNVVAFNISKFNTNDLEKIQGFNETVFIYGFKEVSSDFYPRYAKQRIYRYYLKKNNYDADVLLQALSLFTGKHNFSNFARIEAYKNPVRSINNIAVSQTTNFFIIDFYAQTYLWHQIRRIISAVQKVCMGKINLKQVYSALHNPDETIDFGVASAHPLILKDVIYDFDFQYIDDYHKRLQIIEKRIVNRLLK